MGAVEPVEHMAPVEHEAHSEALRRLAMLEYVPATQGSGAEAPRGQNEPPGQALHAVEPDASWNSPATHIAHSA